MRLQYLLLAGVLVLAGSSGGQDSTPGPNDSTTKAVAAANAFIATLTPDQAPRAVYEYDSPMKPKWNNLPPNMAARAGIPLGSLSDSQRDLALAVVRSVVSAYGYRKIMDVIDADAEFGRTGAGFPTGMKAYMLAVFGKPSLSEPWEIQFNGHHLGLNVTIVGKNNVMAPTMVGAYPNIYQKDGREFHVLGEESGKAIALMQSLNPQQQAKATITSVVGDYILGPGHDGEVLAPEGLKATEMTASQKEMLAQLAAPWVNIINEPVAAAKMSEIRRNIEDTYFAWSGKPDAGEKAYFRMQGPTVWIEFAPQNSGFGAPGGGGRGGGRGGRGASGGQFQGRGQRGAGSASGARGPRVGNGGQPNVTGVVLAERDPNHIHSVFRDFTNDYAKRFAAR
ncbi:MAG TPA: DUF3500 domain-containing protein [Bryobacteraceae bacterium]|nr:DUF3500 domain-containing protein [Bryobacteraceae bacterium]